MSDTRTITRGAVAGRLLGIAALVELGLTAYHGVRLDPTASQGDSVPLLAIHPALAWSAYLAFAVTAVCSALYLWRRTRRAHWDLLAGASAEVGVVLTGLTLATGSLWGRATWGVWWTWDARLTTTALLFVLYLGYLALRRLPDDGGARARRCAIAALVAFVDIPVIHTSVEWARTLHQGRSLVRPDPASQLGGDYLVAMLLGLIAMTLTYAWLVLQRYRLARLEAHAEAALVASALEERRAEATARPEVAVP